MEWSNITITDMQTYFEPTPAVDKIESLFFDAKDYRGTIKAAKKVLLFAKTDSDKFLGHFFIAMSLSEMNDIDKAASESLKALRYCDNFNGSNNSVFWCHNFLARYYNDKKMYEKAMEILEKGFRFASTNEDLYMYYINMARMYSLCGNFQNQFKMAQSALQYAKSDAEIADCYFQMAGSKCDLSEFDLENHGQEAIKYSRLCLDYVKKSLSENKGEIMALRNMARLCYRTISIIYEERGEKDKAAEQVKQALEYTDKGGEEEKNVYMSLVYYDIGQKNIDATENLEMLLCCCDTKKEKYNICNELIGEYMKCNDIQNIFQIAQYALQYAESNEDIAKCHLMIVASQYELGSIHERDVIKEVEICLGFLDRGIFDNQGDISYLQKGKYLCYSTIANFYEKLGEKDKAIEEANHALQYTNGDRDNEKEMYETIVRCCIGRDDGSAIKYLKILFRYCNTDEEKARVHDRLAGEYMKIDDWEKVRKEYEVIVKLNPDKEYIGALIELYHMNGELQLCKDLILKYDIHRDDPGITEYVQNDPELRGYLK